MPRVLFLVTNYKKNKWIVSSLKIINIIMVLLISQASSPVSHCNHFPFGGEAVTRVGSPPVIHISYWNILRKLLAYAIGITSGCGCNIFIQKCQIKLRDVSIYLFFPIRRWGTTYNTNGIKTKKQKKILGTDHCWKGNNVRLQVRRLETDKGTFVTHLPGRQVQEQCQRYKVKTMIQKLQVSC